MSVDLGSSISFLETTNDPSQAYFSFAVDETGEYGIIKANKEGLRLYAAEMLKKSMELEQRQDGEPLYFDQLEWVVSDAGYDLIAGVVPEYQGRKEILAARHFDPEHRGAGRIKKEQPPNRGCLFSILVWVIGVLIFLTSGQCLSFGRTNLRFVSEPFTNLHVWENIH